MKYKRFWIYHSLILLVWIVIAVTCMVKCNEIVEKQYQRVIQLQHRADSLSKRIDLHRRERQELHLKNKQDSIHYYEDGM